MFGDCQVLSAMGGNGMPSDNGLYSSSMQHPNSSFMPAINPFNIFSPIIPKEEITGMAKSKEELMESGSGSEHIEGFSGNEQEAEQQPQAKKKRYHRHTTRQIQEMEALFKECPHPDDKQRLKLSQELGLKPRQVKFWFQNRRTQMKAQQDRQDNVVLRAENESLKNENYRLQATLRNIVCPNCGGPSMLGEMGYDEQQLRIENARLKEELERMCCLVSQYTGRPMPGMGPPPLLPTSLDLDVSSYPRKFEQDHMTNCPPDHMIPLPFMPENSQFPGNALILEEEKPLALDLAVSSMDELVKMCHTAEPLWVPAADTGKQVLNLEEYARMFSWSANLKQHSPQFRTEATRHTAVVIMNSITLVDAFLDANKWMELFPCIISRAKTLQVVHSEVSGHANGSLHLKFRFFPHWCQQEKLTSFGTANITPRRELGLSLIFPLDGLHNDYPPSFAYYKRRPSGCIIQDMPNGYSRVTWVEHAEVEDGPIHQVFSSLVSSGAAFGAQRWLAVLQRQCERLASLMARNISDLGEDDSNILPQHKHFLRAVLDGLSDCADDTVRITTRKVTEPGQPSGLILSAVSTTWLPYQHNQVFDFLRDERRRAQLEVLSNGNSLHEVAHIANGSHPGNCISLLRINVASNSSQSVELVLQESCSDDSGSIVVYTTIDVDAIQMAMNGEDPSCIPLLPLGFVIVPMGQIANNDTGIADSKQASENGTHLPDSGCLLTVGLQVLASTIPSAKLNLSSVTAINHHLCNTVQQINAVLGNISGNNFNENVDILTSNIDPEPALPAENQPTDPSATS
ncbi:UNVERIFIED_CONTAM: Homeobox-leucine zipper protein ROC3 [Sesamum latifolium]|uniref:Homeobox-leucine zipper protein ROC3 n=1 Tax=Sesamum latifolium TaxID=2727402 RepID=A0AAW2WYB5_9LAMI